MERNLKVWAFFFLTSSLICERFHDAFNITVDRERQVSSQVTGHILSNLSKMGELACLKAVMNEWIAVPAHNKIVEVPDLPEALETASIFWLHKFAHFQDHF